MSPWPLLQCRRVDGSICLWLEQLLRVCVCVCVSITDPASLSVCWPGSDLISKQEAVPWGQWPWVGRGRFAPTASLRKRVLPLRRNSHNSVIPLSAQHLPPQKGRPAAGIEPTTFSLWGNSANSSPFIFTCVPGGSFCRRRRDCVVSVEAVTTNGEACVLGVSFFFWRKFYIIALNVFCFMLFQLSDSISDVFVVSSLEGRDRHKAIALMPRPAEDSRESLRSGLLLIRFNNPVLQIWHRKSMNPVFCFCPFTRCHSYRSSCSARACFGT